MQLIPLIQTTPPLGQQLVPPGAAGPVGDFAAAFAALSERVEEREMNPVPKAPEDSELEPDEKETGQIESETDDPSGDWSEMGADAPPPDIDPADMLLFPPSQSAIPVPANAVPVASAEARPMSAAQLTLGWKMNATSPSNSQATRAEVASIHTQMGISLPADHTGTPVKDVPRPQNEGATLQSAGVPTSVIISRTQTTTRGIPTTPEAARIPTNSLTDQASSGTTSALADVATGAGAITADRNSMAAQPAATPPLPSAELRAASALTSQAKSPEPATATAPPNTTTYQKTATGSALTEPDTRKKNSDDSGTVRSDEARVPPPRDNSVSFSTPKAHSASMRAMEAAAPSQSLPLAFDTATIEPDLGTITTDGRSAQAASTTSGPSSMTAPQMHVMVARQIADALKGGSEKSVELTLSPAELGRVRMSLATTDAGVTLVIHAERPETLDLMRRNIAELDREFTDIGYADVDFAFSGGDGAQDRRDERPPYQDDATADEHGTVPTPPSAQHLVEALISSGSATDIRL